MWKMDAYPMTECNPAQAHTAVSRIQVVCITASEVSSTGGPEKLHWQFNHRLGDCEGSSTTTNLDGAHVGLHRPN